MNRFTLFASLAAIVGMLASTHNAVAQSTDKTAAKPAAASKSPPKKSTSKPAAKAATLPDASPEQLAAADHALKGSYECDFNQTLSVAANSHSQGYVDVTSGKSKYTMKPILSSTGALRMEDVTGRMLLLQIANKSMLMDTKLGRRVVDNCVHPSQKT